MAKRILVRFKEEPQRKAGDQARSFLQPYSDGAQPPSAKLSKHITAMREKHNGRQLVRNDKLKGLRVIELPDDADINAVIADYNKDNTVQWAEEDMQVFPLSTPNDPLFSRQWSLPKMHVEEARPYAKHLNKLTVAVIDTGIVSHPELDSVMSILPGCDVSAATPDNDPTDLNPNNAKHGTACAGIIAAVRDNNIGMAGIASGITIMPVKIFTSDTTTVYAVIAGIMFAADNGADIISMSIGGSANSAFEADALDYAHKKGCLIIAAAGNDSWDFIGSPGGDPGTDICVGSTDPYDHAMTVETHRYGHCYGPQLTVLAPGHYITAPTGSGMTQELQNQAELIDGAWYFNPDVNTYVAANRGLFNGTSSATPNVAGVAALIKGTYYGIQPRHIVSRIINSTDPVDGQPTSVWHERRAYGRVNALKAITNSVVSDALPSTFPFVVTGTPSTGPTPGTISVTWDPIPGVDRYYFFYTELRQNEWIDQFDLYQMQALLPGSATSFSAPNIVDVYRVVAYGRGGHSVGYSNIEELDYFGSPFAPVAPFLDVCPSETSIAIRTPLGTLGSALEVSDDNGQTFQTLVSELDSYEYLHTTAEQGIDYRYRVGATVSDTVALRPSDALYYDFTIDYYDVYKALPNASEQPTESDTASLGRVIPIGRNTEIPSGVDVSRLERVITFGSYDEEIAESDTADMSVLDALSFDFELVFTGTATRRRTTLPLAIGI